MHQALALAFLLVLQGDGPKSAGPKQAPEAVQPDPAWKSLGRSLWFDAKEKRLYLRARVALRDGYLEHLMCSNGTKEHEAILATDAVPNRIHAGLLLTGAEAGQPVQFFPKFAPPTGSAIAIELRWMRDGKIQKQDARQWVKTDKNAPLDRDWVFAGSQLYDDPVTKKKRYAADEGDLITVANFSSAILDLPIESSANDADRAFATNTDQIPPVGTEILVALYPRAAKPGAKTGTPAKRNP
jgi:hypothetical protein